MKAREMLELMDKDTQVYKILKFILDYGSITSWDAMVEFNCMRLASRIHDLRSMGIPIKTKTITRGKKHWSSYYLEEDKR